MISHVFNFDSVIRYFYKRVTFKKDLITNINKVYQ